MNKVTLGWRSTWSSMKNVFTGLNFWMAILILFMVLFAEIAGDVFDACGRMNEPNENGAAYLFNIAIHFGYFIYAAPLVCAFAASGNFIEDIEAGYYRHRLLKSGRRSYQYGLFFGSTIAGGSALLFGVLLFAIVCAAFFGTSASIENMAAMEAWLPIVSGKHANWMYMIVSAALAFIFGMVWTGIGLVMSVYSPNRYVSYLAPFIICFSSVLVLPANLQPLEMLVQMNWTTFSFSKLLIYQGVVYLGILIWFRHAFERRIVNE